MSRYFVHLAYQGTNYHGWQYQPNAITVQEVLNKAFSTLLRSEINLTGCGRTDTGVHARNFYAHFDAIDSLPFETDKLVYKLNGILPDDINILKIWEVSSDKNARFDAIQRTYKYYISQKKEIFQKDFCWQLYKDLDIKEMNRASKKLLSYTDFTSFSKLHTDVKTNNCDVRHAEWSYENEFLVFTISADRFLRNMVRSIVGTLIEVGLNKKTTNDFCALIEKKDRKHAGASAPAKGLFLVDITY